MFPTKAYVKCVQINAYGVPAYSKQCTYVNVNVYVYICIYLYMVVDQNSFIRKRPFFANKNVTFAKLSRTPRLSFAGPMSCWATTPLMKIRSPPAKFRQGIIDHFLIAF